MTDCSGYWRSAACDRDQRRKRFCIQQMHLPYKFNLDNIMSVKPIVSLLICDSKLDSNALFLKRNFQKNPFSEMIEIEVDQYLTTQDQEIESARGQREPVVTSKIDLLGIFFQSQQEQGYVRIAYSRNSFRDFNKEVDCFANQLGLNDSHYPKSALLLFVQAYSREAAQLAANLRSRIETSYAEESIWLVRFNKMPEILNSRRNIRPGIAQNIVGLRIAGPNIQSWTIDVDLSLPRIEVESVLRRFRDEIKLKRHSIGLFYAPSKRNKGRKNINPYGSSYELTSCMKRIFVGITFVGLFSEVKQTAVGSIGNGMVVDFVLHRTNQTIFTISYLQRRMSDLWTTDFLETVRNIFVQQEMKEARFRP